jgi:cytochrome c peroxidase
MIKKIVFLLFISGSLISLQYKWLTVSPETEVKSLYLTQIKNLEKNIQYFKNGISQKQPRKDLQKQFKICRLSYKKLAVLTDYFNQFETISLNSPAINRVASEIADRIIPPSGFQAIEDILYSDWEDNNYDKVDSLLNDIIQILHRLEKEPDIEYKFKDVLVWDALRSATVSIATTGITGVDSPTANHSLPEANASIDGILLILDFYKSYINEKDPAAFTELTLMLFNAKKYLAKNNNFNKFNRLAFITVYINPFYKRLVETRIKTGIGIPEGRSAINYNATSIFTEDALNINFYSPSEEYWVTPERIRLGKALFSNPILSGTNTRSCASCHQPNKAFTDGLTKPYALDEKTVLPRNTPTLWNSGFQTKQFYDSRTDILENQLGEVVHNLEEMKGSLKNSVKDLKEDPFYSDLVRKAYPKEKDPVNTFTLANAISSYVRSLRSLNSRFDKYMRGDKEQLSNIEIKGFNLFTGKAKCATCHFIPLFNGVVPPFFADTESEVLGVPASNDKNNPVLDTDEGKFLFTRSVIHKFSFKTPTLRNIELTAPYMHNGVFSTLEEVMEFYNNGGGKGLHIAPSNQTLPFDKLNLSKNEINNIISFMRALTDTTYSFR